jgi:outer membrane protein TolC
VRLWPLLLAASIVSAQTLPEVVASAEKSYASVRVSEAQLAAAASGIALARTAFLPRAELVGQVNRATRNNVFGLFFPTALPGISGPVLDSAEFTNVWGTSVGFIVSWEPFDFGLRRANILTAEATRARAQAAVARTRFEVGALAADAYLTLVAAEQTLRAGKAQVERATRVQTVVDALVRSELRPGADASRSRAEIAIANTQVIAAEQAIQSARVTLKQLTGSEVVAANWNATDADVAPAAAIANNPAAVEQQAAITEAEARLKALDRAFYPRFALQGSSYARGTGAHPDGSTGGFAAGLGPNIPNWAVGFTVTFPVLELTSLRARKDEARHRQAAETARYDQMLTDLTAHRDRALAQLQAAKRIAAEIPAQLEAARAAEQQATARYQAGLGTLIELADAQRLLTQSDIDAALARLNVWRAMLAVSVAEGDLTPFLEKIR